MKPREFLAQRDYPLTVALTYSFDPVFFERMVLPELWSGGAQDVLVLADGGQVDRALQRPHGAVHHLGRRYLLAPVRRRGAFHPKLVLRFGRESGAAWLSTGNLTHGGWGLNQEVAAAWQFGPDHPDTGDWVRPLLRDTSIWAGAPLADRMLDRVDALPWLSATSEPNPRLLWTGSTTLARQLGTRWSGRRFDRLRFLTGSTDDAGAVLRWMADTFGVEEAVGALTPSRCSWDRARVSALPLSLRLTANATPILHAKSYHLSGPDGHVLLIGSANCTPSAWLRSGNDGGNVECVLVYEDPTPEDLTFLDAAIGEAPRPADHVLLPASREPEEAPALPEPPLHLRVVQIEEDGAVVVEVDGVPEDSDVYLVLPDEEILLRRESDHWIGRAPDTLPAGQTAFAHVEARADSMEPLQSGPRWADDLRLLHQNGGLRRLGRVLSDLAKPATQQEDEQLIRELTEEARNLLHDVESFRDPFSSAPKKARAETKAPPVDADSLVRSLYETAVPVAHPISEGSGGISLGGIFRALFGTGEEEVEDEAVEIGPDDADEQASEEGEGPDGDEDATDPDQPPPPVAEKVRAKFAQHVDRFVAEIRSEEFGDRCTATQLVQAVGYPFAATALGLRRGWTDRSTASEWLVQTANVLLREGPEGKAPLLDVVQGRYQHADSTAVFERIVGEGTLWVVLTVGLSSIEWPRPAGALQRMLFLRDLWRAEVLRACAEKERLGALVRRYKAADALRLVRDRAGPVTAAATTLECRLRYLCEEEDLMNVMEAVRRPIEPGELLWGPANDWALPLEPENDNHVRVYWPKRAKETTMTLRGFFVSVPQVAELDPDVATAFQRLLTTWTEAAADPPAADNLPEGDQYFDELDRRQPADVAAPDKAERPMSA